MDAPRLKSQIWVSAYLRRCMVAGLFGAVVKKGAEEAGAVFAMIDRLDGTVRLFGPAPGSSIGDDGMRRWIDETGGFVERPAALAILDRRKRSDPDLWVVEVEDRAGIGGFEGEDIVLS
jgi:hypothetical protein